MNINWYGETCFRINTLKNRNGSANILIDPPDKKSGLRSPKLEADILLFTHPESEKIKLFSNECILITGPGEYDAKEVFIKGISAQAKTEKISLASAGSHYGGTIYIIEAEGIRICHLGKLNQKELTSDQLEKIGAIDILMIPIGGGQSLDAKEAIKIMAQIEPKIIIPMHYQIPGLRIKLDTLNKFLKALSIKSLQRLSKLSIRKKDLSSEEVKIIVLEP